VADKRADAAESGAAVELLASQPKAMKFRLMLAARLFVLLVLLLPVDAEARHQSQACNLTYQMHKWNFPATLQSESIQ